MKLYMLAESDDLAEIEKDITVAIKEWLATPERNPAIQYVSQRIDDITADSGSEQSRQRSLGLTLEVKSKPELKEPLNFLYAVARQNKCEFVIGIIDGDSKEDICYFGHEEGRPDLHEVAMYLEL